MHELSLMQNLVEIIEETAAKHGASHVTEVVLEVGCASGAEPEALEFAWESVCENVLLKNAVLNLQMIPLVLLCNGCGQEYRANEIFSPCPVCGSLHSAIKSGKELRVVSISI